VENFTEKNGDHDSVVPAQGEVSLANLRKQFTQGSLADSVYGALREAILLGRLRGGERLRESELAQEVGVSRTPVREALQRLQMEGFLEITSDGLVVKKYTLKQVIDIYEIRIALEGIAAKLAAERATFGDIVELKGLHKLMSRQLADKDVCLLTNTNKNFHLKMAEVTGCQFLVQFLDLLNDSVHKYYDTTFLDRKRRENAMEEHRKIIDYIEKHDPEAAEMAARDHMKNALHARIQLIEKRGG